MWSKGPQKKLRTTDAESQPRSQHGTISTDLAMANAVAALMVHAAVELTRSSTSSMLDEHRNALGLMMRLNDSATTLGRSW